MKVRTISLFGETVLSRSNHSFEQKRGCVLCRTGQLKPKGVQRVKDDADSERVREDCKRSDGNVGRVQEASKDMEQDERAQDPKEWRYERTLEKHERAAHEQGPTASDAQTDWRHGRSAESHEADGFWQGHDGNVWWWRQVVSFFLSCTANKLTRRCFLFLFFILTTKS